MFNHFDQILRSYRDVRAKSARGNSRGKIAVAIHHALGHAGRATGVDHVDVILAIIEARQTILASNQHFEIVRTRQRTNAAIVDLDEVFQTWQ